MAIMENLKFTIVTPSYNQGRFILRTIDSVLFKQNYKNVEYFVVDGESTDETLDILKEYKNKYSERMNYIYEKDTGQSNAINKGFKKATGDIIGWINSDDYYEDNIFSFVAQYFNENPDVDMLYGGCNLVDSKGGFIGAFEEGYGFKFYKINDYNNFSYDRLLNVYSGLIPQQSVFFRKEVFDKVGYLDESYNFTMDYEFWLRIGRECKIKRVEKVLANFRFHEEAKTNPVNRLRFFKESLKARKKYNGKKIAPFYALFFIVSMKTIVRILLRK